MTRFGEEVIALRASVEAHPMCGKLLDNGHAFTVIYPCGDFPVGGVRAGYARGKAAALNQMLLIMERHWVDSFPGANK